MKHFLLLIFLICSIQLFAQEDRGNCAHIKSKKALNLKSNTLNTSEIAETEEYDISYYFLNLTMSNTSTALSGSGEIHGNARVDLDSILFELFHSLTIDSIYVDGVNTGFSRTNSAVRVEANKLAGEAFVIQVFYHGTPPTAATNPLGGSGMSHTTAPFWNVNVTWSLSEPFSAYEWFPVKQSLRDKADSCAVWITVPNTCKAGSNGVLEQIVDLGNGTTRYEWKHRHPIDYYLISVAIADYLEYNLTANPSNSAPILVQNYIYNNPYCLAYYQNEINRTTDFIELFSDLFGPYPFADEKYGHSMVPISGGMEHQTMTSQGFFESSLTAHELAHQWFGNHVTCASWADIWVNEGFASYAEYLMYEYLFPGDQVQDMQDRHSYIMTQPGGSVWVLDSLNDNRIFSGRLTYDKGAAILHTLRFIINNDTQFFQTLRNIQTVFADSTASGIDLIHQFELDSGLDLSDFAEQWYFGEGYPRYAVKWNHVGSEIFIEINQTTSMPSVTPLFTNDLELKFSRATLPDTIIRFPITGLQNQFSIPNTTDIVNITKIDPNNWIINEDLGIVNDPSIVGVNEVENKNHISIYPNPTNGPLTIEMSTPGTFELQLIDSRGRNVYQTTFSSSTTIDLADKTSGIFIVQVKNSKTGERTLKLIRK